MGSSKDELSQELATSSKIPSMGLGSFSQRVNARDDFDCEKNRGCNYGCHVTRGATLYQSVELGLSNGWAKARKSEIPKIALVSSAAAVRARDVLVLEVTKQGGAGAPPTETSPLSKGGRERAQLCGKSVDEGILLSMKLLSKTSSSEIFPRGDRDGVKFPRYSRRPQAEIPAPFRPIPEPNPHFQPLSCPFVIQAVSVATATSGPCRHCSCSFNPLPMLLLWLPQLLR
ncbi:hypothetical protein PIB30_042728 [Stylosanthes scabra]|uniref:Uncharacterized protein n=1 Tax=Stylosanthes scabra TaxID=79078 RepID=A0ABU6QFD1_9FABA|nr:hypothetical protein [Stylosanthes scabra]